MQFEPLGSNVVVERDAEVKVSPGGIIIPDTLTEKPMEGTILAVGPGKRLESGKIAPMSVGVGDRVLFAKFAGVEIVNDGINAILLINESNILGVTERAG